MRILTRIVDKLIMASDPENYLRSALAKWRKNVKKLSCHDNAKIIQDFCREVKKKVLNMFSICFVCLFYILSICFVYAKYMVSIWWV